MATEIQVDEAVQQLQATSHARQSDRLPLISVIVPFDDRRGEPRHLKSWTQKQTCAGDQFEVIAITVGAQVGIEDQIRTFLRPQDRVIQAKDLRLFRRISG